MRTGSALMRRLLTRVLPFYLKLFISIDVMVLKNAMFVPFQTVALFV